MQTGGIGNGVDPNVLKNEEEVGDEDSNSLPAHLILKDPKEPTGGEQGGVATKPSRDELFQVWSSRFYL